MWAILAAPAAWLDAFSRWWNSPRTRRGVADCLIVTFCSSVVAVELSRRGLLPDGVEAFLGHNHFKALEITFTLLLVAELIELVLGIVRSVSGAVGTQFEVLVLILLRRSFKELTHLAEPLSWPAVAHAVPSILADAGGALAVFVVLALYLKAERHLPFVEDADQRASFVAGKKVIALMLLVALALLGCCDLVRFLRQGQGFAFFEVFYTILVFADVLVVLLSMRYTSEFEVVFRYFGFAVAAVLVRLALTAPPLYSALMGVAASLFALALSWACAFYPRPRG